MPMLLALLTSPAAPPVDAAQTQKAVVLFVIVLTILGLFMVGLLLILAARRSRRQPAKTTKTSPQPDPWRTAADRIDPDNEDDLRE